MTLLSFSGIIHPIETLTTKAKIMFKFYTIIDGLTWKVVVTVDDEDDGFDFDIYHPDGEKDEEYKEALSERDIYNHIWVPYKKSLKLAGE